MNMKLAFAGTMAALIMISCGHEEASKTAPKHQTVSAKLVQVQEIHESRPIEIQGFVQPEKESFLSSRAMGPVVHVYVGAGDRVSQNDMLIEIQQDLSHGQLAQAKGAQAQAQAELSMAERNYERFQKLYDKESCSELELDMAKMQFEQAKGATAQATGAVEAASSVAEESVVRASFDGIVVEKMVNLGDLAAPGRPLVRLQSLTGHRLWLTVRESDIKYVHAGMKIPVSIDSRQDLKSLEGTVVEIVPAADMATHSFMVKVELGEYDLMTGLTGRATIPGESREHMMIPETAVYRAGGLSLVTVVDASSVARTRAVTTGRVSDGMVEVLTGINRNDRVIKVLNKSIPDGTPIKEVN